MAIPDNRMSTVPVPGIYIPPNGEASQLLEWHEGGPIAINDTSSGLNFQGWSMTYSDPDFTITPDTVGLPQVVHSVAAVTQLSFCFDQNGRVTIAYTAADVAYLYWFNTVEGMFVTTASALGAVSPAVTLDDKRVTQTQSSDMLLFYTKQQMDLSYTLYMRMQRDRFDVEYEMETHVRPNIINLGMNNGLRVQISLVGDVPVIAPVVQSPTATDITETTATLGGQVSSDGGDPVTERGTVWGLTADPNIIDEVANKNIVAGTLGTFTGPVTGLPDTTLINYRAYAINSIGTGYSVNSTFTTDTPVPPPSSTLKDQLLAWYTLETAGATWADAHTTNNDLTDFNSVTAVPAVQSNGANFVAASSQRLERTAFSFGTGSFTIGGFFSHDAGQAGDHRPFQQRGTGAVGSGVPGITVKFYSNSGFVHSKNSGIGIEDGAGNNAMFGDINFSIANDTFFHFLLVLDRALEKLFMYVNGVEITGGINTASVGDIDTARLFSLGGSDVTSAQFWDGIGDEVVVYNRALIQSEIDELYNGGAGITYADVP